MIEQFISELMNNAGLTLQFEEMLYNLYSICAKVQLFNDKP